MKRINLNIWLFVLLLYLLGSLNILNTNKPTVSELENRALQERPVFTIAGLVSGDYLRAYEDFFADTFIFRDSFVRMSSRLKGLWSFGRDEVTIVVHRGSNVSDRQTVVQPTPLPVEDGQMLSDGILPQSDGSGTLGPEEPKPSPPPAPSVPDTGYTLGRVLVYNDSAMEIHSFNEKASSYYANALNSFRKRLADDVQVYSLLAPTQIEFIPNERYRSLSDSQLNTINHVYRHLDVGIMPVNAYDALQRHASEYLYFRSDHHWTALGAYHAYTAFMHARGEMPIPIERYEIEQVTPFLGSMYSATLHESIRNNPDTIYLYKPYLEHRFWIWYEGPIAMDVLDMSMAESNNKYRIFISGDRPWAEIESSVKNGKKVVVIKDSYGNAMIPFLIPHYEEIYVVDPRQFQLDIFEFIAEKGIQEVLFLNYVLVTEQSGFADLLMQMVNR